MKSDPADPVAAVRVPQEPPAHLVDLAIEMSGLSPCRSKRGVVIFNGENVVTYGYNYKPRGFDCDGSAACKATCRTTAVHAEQRALLAAGRQAYGAEMLHVKSVNGQLVASGGPSCVQCSKLALAAGIAGMWLYHADGWRRYDTADWYRQAVDAAAPLVAPAPSKGAEMISVDLWTWKCLRCDWTVESQLTVNRQQSVAEALIRLHIESHESRSPDGDGPTRRCSEPATSPANGTVSTEQPLDLRAGSEPADSLPLSAGGRLPALPEPETWQPIATAPKMRTILLWAATDVSADGTIHNWKMATGSWHTGYEDERSKARGLTPWTWDGAQLHVYEVQPTHWMPLPEPPDGRPSEAAVGRLPASSSTGDE